MTEKFGSFGRFESFAVLWSLFRKVLVFLFIQTIVGNANTFAAEMRIVSPPIIARKVRIVPYSNHPRTVCLRLELYGCTWRG